MEILFRAVAEDEPGPRWAGLFQGYWPGYRLWWAREGIAARPTYHEGRQAIRRHMPELLGLYDRLCELAGGGDQAARFLSFWRPPPYLAGCSQAVWPGDSPLLVRNYDYDPRAFDAVVLRTRWGGRGVVGSTDGLWGLVDGVNEAGLAVSLTFGGRRETGEGFGVPLILRYVLQTCGRVEEAVAALRRIPCHMSYNVTALDREGRFATVYLAPDRKAIVTRQPAATNHQATVEWPSHARWTASVERERYLLTRLTNHPEEADSFVGAFLRPPLYSLAFDAGFGTLYTAVYEPRRASMELRWPGMSWRLPLDGFEEGTRGILTPVAARSG